VGGIPEKAIAGSLYDAPAAVTARMMCFVFAVVVLAAARFAADTVMTCCASTYVQRSAKAAITITPILLIGIFVLPALIALVEQTEMRESPIRARRFPPANAVWRSNRWKAVASTGNQRNSCFHRCLHERQGAAMVDPGTTTIGDLRSGGPKGREAERPKETGISRGTVTAPVLIVKGKVGRNPLPSRHLHPAGGIVVENRRSRMFALFVRQKHHPRVLSRCFAKNPLSIS